MNAWLPRLWLLALVATPSAHAQGVDSFGLTTCRAGARLDVYSELSQDEGGMACSLTRFSFSDGGAAAVSLADECLGSLSASADGGVEDHLGVSSTGTLEWKDPTCRPLRRVALRLDARLVPARPTTAQLDEADAHGVPDLTSVYWREREPLRRQVEVHDHGRVAAAVGVELQTPEVVLEGYDVGDRRHLLLAAKWTFAFNEGAPVGTLWFHVVPLDASRLPTAAPDGGFQVLRAVPTIDTLVRSRERARWLDAFATALEARRSPRAKEARVVATRARQAVLVGTREFSAAVDACNRYSAASGDRQKLDALVQATATLRAATRPTDWPLAVDALDWDTTDCHVALPTDAGVPGGRSPR